MNPIDERRYLFITAALGPRSIHDAAKRLIQDAQALRVFSEYVVVEEDDFIQLMPEILNLIPHKDWKVESKFGYFIWKPVLAKLAFEGAWGDFDGVCYLDAGCEILPSYWSRKSMLRYLQRSSTSGAIVFSSVVEEIKVTKARVFDLFPNLNRNDLSAQVAGGSWFMAGDVGKNLSTSWARIATANYANINEDLELERESPHFVSPRHDQSILSLLCKSHGIIPEPIVPPGGEKRFRTQARTAVFAFRWARNLSGVSVNHNLVRLIGSVSLQVYFKFRTFLKYLF